MQGVEETRCGNDGGAMLIIVKDRDAHAFPQLRLHIEALRRLDVLKVDAAKGRLQRSDDAHQLVRIVLGDLQIEDVDAGELLEQATFALHHRLAGQRADIAEPEHRCAVGDHGDQVAARGQP